MRPRHRLHPTGPSTRPADEDVAYATGRLHCLIDEAIECLLLLDPTVATWEAPVGSIDRAIHSNPRFVKAHRRVHEVLDRLRSDLPGHADDLDDLDTAVRRAMSDAGEVGWRLGIMMSRNLSMEAV